MPFVELLQCVLCCEQEDNYDYRQAQRDLGHGDPLLDRIRSAFRLLPTHHHREHEWRSQAPHSLLWNTHNPMSRDPIKTKNEPNLTRTVDGLTQSSQVTSPFKAVASASPKPSPSVSKPSNPFVSPAIRAAISTHPYQSESKSSGCWNEPSLSRLLHPSLSKTCSPTPQVQQRSSPESGPHKWVDQAVVSERNLTRTVGGLTQSSQVTSPFKAVALASPKPSPSVSKPSAASSSNPFVSPAKPAAISGHLNQYVSKSSECSNEPSLSRSLHPSLSKTSSPTPQVQQRSSPIPEPHKRDEGAVVSETNLTRTVGGITQSSQVTSPFKAVASSSLKPSPSVSKPPTSSSSVSFVSPAKPAAISAHLNQYVSKSSKSSNEPSLSRLLHPSLSKTSSPTPQVQQLSSPIPKPHKRVERAVVSETKPPPISAHSNQNVAKQPRPSDEPSSSRVQFLSSPKTTLPSPKAQERSAKQYKPVLRAVSPLPPNQQKETVYVQKDTSPIYSVPEDIEDLIKRDNVPGVLQKPLSPSTYRDYFAALLYAEDVYVEKWTDLILKDVILELHQLTIYDDVLDNGSSREKTFVKFKMESVPGHRPFLLSRDFVFAKPLDERDTKFQGFVYRVEKSSIVLAEFGDDFHSQHHSSSRYDISFSFNRVCLKRAHQAVEAATDPSFGNFLFPICATRRDLFALPSLFFSNDVLYSEQRSAIRQILTLKGSPPFLMEGPLCTRSLSLSKAGVVVREAVSQIHRRFKDPRILVAAPTNKTCDVLMRSLKKEIPDSEIFRANAAFRELDGVPDDILPSCLYEKTSDCFACPPLQELRKFKVIFSTFVSSFRLHSEGINAGHFSHIFLVDASSTSEPEAMIVLANLANEDTTVIISGARGNRSGWVRSRIAQENGLRISYFERLKEFTPYKELDPKFIAPIGS